MGDGGWGIGGIAGCRELTEVMGRDVAIRFFNTMWVIPPAGAGIPSRLGTESGKFDGLRRLPEMY